MSLEKQIFKKGSNTFYFSSKFFPKEVRQDVFKLYSFLRVTDNYVDDSPQNKKEFIILRTLWDEAVESKSFVSAHHKNDSLNERLVKNMLHLTKKYKFDPAWVNAFFTSQQADLDKKTYASLDGTLWYVYGSAEVVGLMMSQIMDLPKKAHKYAMLQGRAFQWINFIRDIEEDNKLGRCYFPREDLAAFNLKTLNKATAEANPKAFQDFMRFQIRRYNQWQREAEKGYQYIPKHFRVPLETAVDGHNWTARQIANNPKIVFEKKVKPSWLKLTVTGLNKSIS